MAYARGGNHGAAKGTASCRATPSRHAPTAAQTWCSFGRAPKKSGFSDPRWLTFNQARETGGTVRKGEKGETVVFVSKLIKTNDDGTKRTIPFLKAFTLFNVAQCDGLPARIADPDAAQRVVNPNTRDEIADAFMSATGATIRHGEARAYYRPIDDLVNLPPFETFTNASAYYGVAFHELVHRHIQKIQGPLPLGHAHHRNRRGFIVGFAKGGETSAAPSV